MNNKHWEKFYKGKEATKKPSQFAQDMLRHMQGFYVYDLGGGNGRDAIYFAKTGLFVTMIDPSGEPYKQHKRLMNVKKDMKECDYIFREGHVNRVYYSRFFIHAIEKEETKRIISNIPRGSRFIAEFRIDGDKPKLYKDHSRILWNSNRFIYMLLEKKFDIIYMTKGHGMANYKGEDPLIMRIIAIKQ